LPHFHAVVVQAIGTRCDSVAAASIGCGVRSVAKLFSPASHLGPDAIGRLLVNGKNAVAAMQFSEDTSPFSRLYTFWGDIPAFSPGKSVRTNSQTRELVQNPKPFYNVFGFADSTGRAPVSSAARSSPFYLRSKTRYKG